MKTKTAVLILILGTIFRASSYGSTSTELSAKGPAEMKSQLPEPSLEGMDASVIEAVETRRAELAAALAEPSSTAKERAVAYASLGMVYQAHKLAEVAVVCYAEARKLEPNESRWAYLAGLGELETNDLEAAERSFKEVLELRPGTLPALLRLGETLLLRDQVAEAKGVFERALEIDPEGAPALSRLGLIAARQKQDEKALELLERALALQPEATRLHYHLAQSYRRLGDQEKAKMHAKLFGDKDVVFREPLLTELMQASANPSNDMQLASRALRKGKTDLAIDLYRKTLSIEPENAGAYSGLAIALESQGRLEDALAACRESIRIDPNNAVVRGNMASLLVRLGSTEEAIEELAEALRLDPESRDQHLKMAWLLEGSDRIAEALLHYRKVLEWTPDDGYVLLRHGLVLKGLGRLEEAGESLEKLVALEPEDMNARVVLASILADLGRPQDAIEQLDLAMGLEDEGSVRAMAHFTRGLLYARKGEGSRAIEELETALGLDRSLVAARFLIANILAIDGRFAEASIYYDEILSLEAGNLSARMARVTTGVLGGDFETALRLLEEGLERSPDELNLTHALAHLLATCPDPSIRAGDRGLLLAQQVFEADPSLQHGETLAMAFAEMGRFEEAVELQEKLLREAKNRNQSGLQSRLSSNLERYRKAQQSAPLWILPD